MIGVGGPCCAEVHVRACPPSSMMRPSAERACAPFHERDRVTAPDDGPGGPPPRAVAAGLAYYVMPYVHGQTLLDHLSERGRLPLDEALRIVKGVADALAFAHRK